MWRPQYCVEHRGGRGGLIALWRGEEVCFDLKIYRSGIFIFPTHNRPKITDNRVWGVFWGNTFIKD